MPNRAAQTAARAIPPAGGHVEPSCISAPEGAFERLSEIVRRVAGLHAVNSDAPDVVNVAGSPRPDGAEAAQPATPAASTWISFGLMSGDTRTIPVSLPIDRVPEILNEVGSATVGAGLPDVQFWVQERRTKARAGLEKLWGVIIDVDRESVDYVGEVQRAGVPVPNVHFRTARGFKLVYLFSRPATGIEAEAWAKALTLSFECGDPSSWAPGQGQRLPIFLKTTSAGLVDVSNPARVANNTPLDPALESIPFPERIRAHISDARLSPEARRVVEDFLAENGMTAPESPGSHLHPCCPDASHDTDCCYVRRSDAGVLSVVCLGGHGGEGLRRWSESQLASLAGIDARTATTGTDILTDVPLTWATMKLVETRLAHLTAQDLGAVTDLLVLAKARQEAERDKIPPTHLHLVIRTILRRLRGSGHVGPTMLHFSEGYGTLAQTDRDGRVRPIIFKGDALSPRTHLHKYVATTGWRVQPTADGYVAGPTYDSHSLFNMALGGHPGALAELGIPILRTFDLPVAHVTEQWQVQPTHRNIHAVIPYRWKNAGVAAVDPVGFFMRLFAQRRLPLATENDVRVFLMALASPLLRHIGQGQLGIYWLHGPVGSGKDYLAEMIAKVWERVARAGRLAKFDLTLTDELELKRSFFSGIGAVYARAKEAGKRKGIADLLIRLAGTDYITARGMRRDEATIPNLFTIVADSAEDVPDRREISRRTAMIEVAHIDEQVSKGDVLREVLDNAEGLLLGLAQLVESRPTEWYQSQANLGSRPLIPVALSRLLGAELPVVKGRDLDDVFDAMVEYISRFAGDEGEKQRSQARDKDGREAQLLKHYRFSAFIETMKKQVGYAETFEGHKASSTLVTWITRETNYLSVDRGREPYLPVTIGDTRYGFKIVKGRRAFVLLPEAEFCSTMGCQPVVSIGSTSGGVPAQPYTTPAAATPTARAAGEPMTFTDDELQGDQP